MIPPNFDAFLSNSCAGESLNQPSWKNSSNSRLLTSFVNSLSDGSKLPLAIFINGTNIPVTTAAIFFAASVNVLSVILVNPVGSPVFGSNPVGIFRSA